MQALAGTVDFLWYDQEHTPMAPEVLGLHLLACRGRGTPGLVRIPGPNAAPGADMVVPWGACEPIQRVYHCSTACPFTAQCFTCGRSRPSRLG